MKIEINSSDLWDEIHLENETVPSSIRKNSEKLQLVANKVKERGIRSVVLVGRGSSEHALQYSRLYFEINCGMRAEIFSPSVITRYHASYDFSQSLVIGVSQCGEAKDVWEVLMEAKKQGAVVVSMTNAKPCLMSNIDEFYINLECGKELSFTAAKSYLTQAALLITLGAYITDEKDQINSIANCGNLIEQTYKTEPSIREAISLFRNVSDIMILGRGYSYAVALETELKIQEASYTNGRAYASTDYQHGPISTTKRFMPFIVFLTDEATDETTVTLLKKLKEDFKISSLVVTNKEQYCELGDYSVLLPDKCEGYMSLFGLAVFSQMFACLLSFARGYHPDKPLGLSKVTVTY